MCLVEKLKSLSNHVTKAICKCSQKAKVCNNNIYLPSYLEYYI